MISERINNLLLEITSKFDQHLLNINNLDPSFNQILKWKQCANKIIPLLDDNDIKYTLIKVYDILYAHMIDLDLLIEDKLDMIKTISILKKASYKIKKLQFFYPYKLNALKEKNDIIIDLYHKPKWYDFTYAQENLITSSRIKSIYHGVKAFYPTPELNIYLAATHSYSHGRITLEEIFHIANVIIESNPDFFTLTELVNDFRTGHILYCYLALVNNVFNAIDYENDELKKFMLSLQNNAITMYFKKWVDDYSPFNYYQFPINIPFTMLSYSGFTSILSKSLHPSVNKYGELVVSLRHFFPTKFIFHQMGLILQRDY
ncbi:MAG: hypothetical protein ACFFDN_16200 [Candidatus Hodarchaeota archaeon]